MSFKLVCIRPYPLTLLCQLICSNSILHTLLLYFCRLGKLVGGSPWITILISLILSGSCLIGLMEFTQESRGEKLWTPEDSLAQKHKNWVDANFPTEVRVSIALVVAGDVLTPLILKEVS